MAVKRIVLALLGVGLAALSIRNIFLANPGDFAHWAPTVPTGTDQDTCMGLTRSQYVPFWCLMGALVVAYYALAAAWERRAELRQLLQPKKVAVGLQERLLESGDALSVKLPSASLREACASAGASLEQGVLAVLLCFQHRRSFGAATVAHRSASGLVSVDAALEPSMKLEELVKATARAVSVGTKLDSDASPEVTFVWGEEEPKAGLWTAREENDWLTVTAPTRAELSSFELLFRGCTERKEENAFALATCSGSDAAQQRTWGAAPKDLPTLCGGEAKSFPSLLAQAAAPAMDLAVMGPEFQLSYGELRKRVAAVADLLKGQVAAGGCVVVYMGRGEALAPAFLGVLQAGLTAVPVDVHWPVERARAVAEDSGAELALVDARSELAWAKVGSLSSVLVGDKLWEERSGAALVDPQVSLEAPAITLFTSGSTGKPKGILLSHGYVLALASGRAASLLMNPGTRTLLHQSPTWMPFIDYLFGPLLVKGCCVMVPEAEQGRPAGPGELRQLALKHDATILGFVPPVLEIFLDEPLPAKLRTVCVGGAAVPAELCRRACAAFKKSEDNVPGFLVTGYHGTEQGDVTQIRLSTDEDVDMYVSGKGFMTSGRPHTVQTVAVLDPGMELCGVGAVGEITVQGPGLASGYLKLPEKTAETFLQVPELGRAMRTADLGRWTAGGSLEVVGRRDSMVKVRGARVELGEVEATIAAHPGVRACAVLVHSDRLVAYVSPAVPGDLKEACQSRLASYMVPHVFQSLEQLPQLANGKINRKALPAPAEGEAETVMELDSLGQMRKFNRASVAEDRILDNVRALLMIIVVQSHATPLSVLSPAMTDNESVPMVAVEWSSLSWVLLQMTRSGGWSALAYMAGFDDTRGDSQYKLTYRELLFVILWVASGFEWTLWFLPAFVYMRACFVLAHKTGLMRTHMMLLGQIWLTAPLFVDWYVGWKPAPAGAETQCAPGCFCPLASGEWAHSLAYHLLGMWSINPNNLSHSFVGRALFFVPCYWLGFFTGRPLFKGLVQLQEFPVSKRCVVGLLGLLLYLCFLGPGRFIEAGFDDRCSSMQSRSGWEQLLQLLKNASFYFEMWFTSLLYVIVVVALVPGHLQRLAKVSFAAYVAASFAPVFCLMDLPQMALEIRQNVNPSLAPVLETAFIFAQPVVFVLVVGSAVMWVIQTSVRLFQKLP